MSNLAKYLKLVLVVLLLFPLTPVIVTTLWHNFVAPMSQGVTQLICMLTWFAQAASVLPVAERFSRAGE